MLCLIYLFEAIVCFLWNVIQVSDFQDLDYFEWSSQEHFVGDFRSCIIFSVMSDYISPEQCSVGP